MKANCLGVLVSLISPGTASFNSVSILEGSLTVSPILLNDCLKPLGPSRRVNCRFPAVLSLCLTAASHISLIVIPVSTLSFATGA